MTSVRASTLAHRVDRAPLVPGSFCSDGRLKTWLASLGSDECARQLKQLFDTHPAVTQLINGIAQASPFLWDLVRVSPQRLLSFLITEPEQAFERILLAHADAITPDAAEPEVMRALRLMRADAALLIALADLGGVWTIPQVLEFQTKLADTAINLALDYIFAEPQQHSKLYSPSKAHPGQTSGFVALAMGKMGAGELNYSSDIDLVLLYDAAAVIPGVEPAWLFVRAARKLVKLLQLRTPDGYAFRVDLRLRPDPSATQIAISTAAALDYYENRGQNWERAALIKARPCAGAVAVGEKFLAEISPFVWRKYLDFAAVADVHAMKRQIHAYRGHDTIAVEGHNLKLGRGGIREIEFFVQTQQLIAGGRHPELRCKATLAALEVLERGGWIDAKAREQLSAAYCFLRKTENRLQMIADEQTHVLPSRPEELEHFARFCGFADRAAFADVLLTHLRDVQAHYASLFEHSTSGHELVRLSFSTDTENRETLDRLASMGFRQPPEIAALARRWQSGAYPSLRSPFAREQLGHVLPILFDHFARAANPDDAAILFDRFLSGLHGGARLLSLLRQNPDLIALLALVLGSAPRLADSLAQFPEVMDAVIDPSFFGPLPEEEELATALARSLQQTASYEEQLDRVRIFAQEQMFLIGVRILSGTVSADQAGEGFARLADVLIRSLSGLVEMKFAATHGRIAGQHMAVLALGKLGAREMTSTSDLDLIVIYDFDSSQPESDGPRPLYGAQYFSRLTQRLIGALTARTNYGALYQVDMRLRPSGRAGPLATHIEGFASYQETEAWTWEHMALTRARVVSASPGFAERVEKVLRAVLCRQRDAKAVAADVLEMRRAIAAEKGEKERWDLKYAAGGLIDIEFLAQYLKLVHAWRMPELLDPSTARAIEKACQAGVLAAEDAEVLLPAIRLYLNLTQILRLCLPAKLDPSKATPGVLALLARAADVPDFGTLDPFLAETQTRVRAIFSRTLGT
jgi:[glutamine synthetase] adenylyltransferase / [glutamine synthetase]-adenylyl-L-tyrosine phosphorylase